MSDTTNSPSNRNLVRRGPGFLLFTAAVIGLAAAPARAEFPRYLPTPYCHGEGKCVLITMKAVDNSANNWGTHTSIHRVLLIFTKPCTYGLVDGGTKTITDTTLYEVAPGETEFIREWRVPAGCSYQIAALKDYALGPDKNWQINLSGADTSKALCFTYDFGNSTRTDTTCQ